MHAASLNVVGSGTPEAKRLIVSGDRDWTDAAWMGLLMQAIANSSPEAVIVHGAAKGADMLAAEAAEKVGLIVEPHPAKWAEQGRSAGPRRNIKMLELGAVMVLAHHDDIRRSKGTKHMCEIALNAGVPVLLFSHSPTGTIKCQKVNSLDLA